MKAIILLHCIIIGLSAIAQEPDHQFSAGIIMQTGPMFARHKPYSFPKRFNALQIRGGVSGGLNLKITDKVYYNLELDFVAPLSVDTIVDFDSAHYSRAIYKTYGSMFGFGFNYKLFPWFRVGTGIRLEFMKSFFYQDSITTFGWQQKKYNLVSGRMSAPLNIFIDFKLWNRLFISKSSFIYVFGEKFYMQTGIYYQF